MDKEGKEDKITVRLKWVKEGRENWKYCKDKTERNAGKEGEGIQRK